MLALAQSTSSGGTTLGVLLLIGVLCYFVPSIVALLRRVPNAGSVVVINVLAGWTLVGWVVAMAMAARSRPAPVSGFPTGPR